MCGLPQHQGSSPHRNALAGIWNRHWHRLPGAFMRCFNRLAGCGGVVGGVGIIVWWQYPNSVAGLAIAGTGAFFLTLAMVVVLFLAWPPRRIEVASAVDRELTLAELRDLYPPLTVFAVVGPGAAGKTTLRERLGSNRKVSHTTDLRAFVVPLEGPSPRHIVVLDANGEDIPQQEVLIEQAEVLIWIVDHNSLGGKLDVDLNRVNFHKFFFGQAESILARRPAIVQYLAVLINKRDLWEASPVRSAMEDFVGELRSMLDSWKGRFVTEVCILLTSNEIAGDIDKVQTTLLQLAR